MRDYFYQRAFRNYTAIMLDLFNDLTILDTNDTVSKTKNIPCTYTPKEKLFYILKEADNEKKLDTSLPRMALYVDSIEIALDRALNTYAKRRFILSKSASDRHYDMMPVPYNFNFGLSLFTRYTDHTSQVMENILPWFNPSITIRVREQGLVNLVREIPVVLSSYTPNIRNEFTEGERRIFQSDYNFLLEGWIYKPLNSGTELVYDFTGNVNNYTHVPYTSGGQRSETVSVSGTGTLSNPSYVVDLNVYDDNMGS